MEAEALCAYLYKKDVVSGIASNDSDILAYGCSLITDFQFSNDDEGNKIVMTDHSALTHLLDLNAEQFLDFCIMCGTDYNENIFRIGAVKSYDLIKCHKTIESVGKFLDPTDRKGTILILNHNRVREIFQNYGMSSNYDSEMDYLKNKAVWSSAPDFYLLCLFGMKLKMTIDFDWMKEGFEKCNVQWEGGATTIVAKSMNEDHLDADINEEDDYFPIF
jgi:5'-3' exonuclease